MPTTLTVSEIRTRATADAIMSPRTEKFVACIIARFNEEYGAAWKAGLLGGAIVPALIRSIAFDLVAGQDESIDLNLVVPYVESAVSTLVHHPRLLAK